MKHQGKAVALRVLIICLVAALCVAALPARAEAGHSWNGWRWARTGNPFVLPLGNNLTTSTWRSLLGSVSADWSASSVLDTAVVAGQGGSSCSAQAGRVEVCNRS